MHFRASSDIGVVTCFSLSDQKYYTVLLVLLQYQSPTEMEAVTDTNLAACSRCQRWPRQVGPLTHFMADSRRRLIASSLSLISEGEGSGGRLTGWRLDLGSLQN